MGTSMGVLLGAGEGGSVGASVGWEASVGAGGVVGVEVGRATVDVRDVETG